MASERQKLKITNSKQTTLFPMKPCIITSKITNYTYKKEVNQDATVSHQLNSIPAPTFNITKRMTRQHEQPTVPSPVHHSSAPLHPLPPAYSYTKYTLRALQKLNISLFLVVNAFRSKTFTPKPFPVGHSKQLCASTLI